MNESSEEEAVPYYAMTKSIDRLTSDKDISESTEKLSLKAGSSFPAEQMDPYCLLQSPKSFLSQNQCDDLTSSKLLQLPLIEPSESVDIDHTQKQLSNTDLNEQLFTEATEERLKPIPAPRSKKPKMKEEYSANSASRSLKLIQETEIASE